MSAGKGSKPLWWNYPIALSFLQWSHNDTWMVTGDHGGYIKYWQSNMNNVKMFQAHKEPVRDVSFSPTDTKFARYATKHIGFKRRKTD